MRAWEASTLAAPYLSRNTHLKQENLLKITHLGYTLGRSRVRGLSRMFKPNGRSGDGGLAEIERRRRGTGSFERSGEQVARCAGTAPSSAST